MKTKRVLLIALVLVAGLIAALVPRAPPTPAPGAPLTLVIARYKLPHSGLIHIAEAKGYFAEVGLIAKMKDIQTGYEAISQMLKGDVDIAVAGETPLALMLAQGRQPKVIATIFISQWNSGLIARKDHGIAQPRDLQGKKIGFVFSTTTHFELETFLAFHNIPTNAVTMVPGEANALVADLASGSLDAVALWVPYMTQAQQRLGDKAVTFSSKEFYAEMTNLVVRPGYVQAHRDAVDRLLRALLKAEAFAKAHPDESLNIIAKVTGVEPAVLRAHGDPLTYELSLHQSLLLATENEIRWCFRRNMAPKAEFPDVLQAFETEPLRALKANAVTIVK